MSTSPAITGRCMCGKVTYTTDEGTAPVMTALCHCEDCRRSSGSAFSVNVVVPKTAFHIEGETLKTFATTGTDSGLPRERLFCSNCGSPLVTMITEMPDAAIIKAGTLDEHDWVEPALELWTDSGHAWVQADAERQKLPRGVPAPA